LHDAIRLARQQLAQRTETPPDSLKLEAQSVAPRSTRKTSGRRRKE
jgi:hypothetical protein